MQQPCLCFFTAEFEHDLPAGVLCELIFVEHAGKYMGQYMGFRLTKPKLKLFYSRFPTCFAEKSLILSSVADSIIH